MNCKTCGYNLTEDDIYCPVCGLANPEIDDARRCASFNKSDYIVARPSDNQGLGVLDNPPINKI